MQGEVDRRDEVYSQLEPDGLTLRIGCPGCGRARLVVMPACCKYQKLGWEIVKKCPLQCGYVERVL